jgi:hypothetical protein
MRQMSHRMIVTGCFSGSKTRATPPEMTKINGYVTQNYKGSSHVETMSNLLTAKGQNGPT